MIETIAACAFFSGYMFMLVILVFLLFSMIFTHAAVDSFLADELDQDIQYSLEAYFGSIPIAMVTLFKVTSGGIAWSKVHDTMAEVSAIYDYVFLAFMFFMV